MSDTTISIFGSKIFLEILNEIELFSEYKTKYYEDLDLCIKDSETKNSLAILFLKKEELNFFDKSATYSFPLLLINQFSSPKSLFLNDLTDQLNMPFTIFELKKKIVSLIAKNKFKKNSLIKLNNYIIDKNERTIRKDNLKLKLSEKEINFLILFSKNSNPVSRKLVLKNVWHYSSESETHTVETHIYRLRKKILKKFNDNNFIKNNNKGYYI